MISVSSGKAKGIYETPDCNLLFEFTNRVTAFDGKKKAEFQEKVQVT
jgi:phosphoribosylaminoimidazole-succinocarboxamide synthase